MHSKAWQSALLIGWLVAACGTAQGPGGDPTVPPGSDPAASSGGGSGSSREGAVVQVELRGANELSYPNGSRITIERFVVNLGGVSLFRDLADPAGSRLDLAGLELPIIAGPGEPVIDRFVIGRDKLQGGGFRGIKLELSPPVSSAPGAKDEGSTIFFRAIYVTPPPDSKADYGQISPNPAPIEPTSTGQAAQPLASSFRLAFTFQSRKAEDLLVGLGEGLTAGRTLVVVFGASRWFSEEIRSFLGAEASTRIRLGISGDNGPALMGEGFVSANESQNEMAHILESNILDSIGVEIR
jgi:hypothetical protein